MNSTNNMQDLELWFKTNAKNALKKSTPIPFEITNEVRVAITKEGPVTYEEGHYLVSNGISLVCPTAPSAFMALYDIIPEQVGVATPKAIEKLATIHVVNRQQKRPRGEEFTSDSDSDSTTTKAYDNHRKKCKESNTSVLHGGAYMENGVTFCTLCDEQF